MSGSGLAVGQVGRRNARSRRSLLAVAAAAIVAILAAVTFRFISQRWAHRAPDAPAGRSDAPAPAAMIQGLSESEATRRRAYATVKTPNDSISLTVPHIWRTNALSVFNLNLVGLAITLLVLGQTLNALGTLVLMGVNIGVNVAQQLIARKRLGKLARLTRSRATVIRSGAARSVDPSELVLGDVLAIGPGDEILADGRVIGDGRILVDESAVTGHADTMTKQEGDALVAGSFCIRGRAAYQIGASAVLKKVSPARRAMANRSLSPLQLLIRRILQIMLVLVSIFFLLIVIDALQKDTAWLSRLPPGIAAFVGALPGANLINRYYHDVVSIIFGLAPSGLFFMLVIGYTLSAAEIARLGALVRRVETVESLAQVNVVCFGKTGTLTGGQVDLDMAAPAGAGILDENRVRHILGDFARSLSTRDAVKRALTNAFEGQPRQIVDEAPFLATRGWSGMAFDDVDLRGVFVLGDSRVVEAHLAPPDIPPVQPEDKPPQPSARLRISGWVRNTLKKADDSRLRRLLNRVRRRDDQSEQQPSPEPSAVPASEQPALIFAYRPGISPLRDTAGRPRLPSNLIPLCRLYFPHQVRPEARDTVLQFAQAGMHIKLLSADLLERVVNAARQLGLGESDTLPLRTISGPELATLPAQRFAEAAAAMTVFGDLTSQQKTDVVAALRRQGQRVAAVGDGADDVPTLTQADLGICMANASQAALAVSDIILVNDSLSGLPRVLAQGQRTLNGLLDLLKLSLTQTASLLLITAAVPILGIAFPYTPMQSGLIGMLTTTLVFLPLSLWAPSGAVAPAAMIGDLARYVLPASVASAFTALIAYEVFMAAYADVAYARLAVTYAVTAFGLVLAVYVRPPIGLLAGGGVYRGDRRALWLFIGLNSVLVLFGLTPLAPVLYEFGPLKQWSDYLAVGLIVGASAMIPWIAWRIRRPRIRRPVQFRVDPYRVQ